MLDTRNAVGYSGSKPAAGSSVAVPVRGLYGVPSNATAVAVQVTATATQGPTFLSVLPTGTAPGLTSNLNADAAGATIANLAIVPIGPDGSITVYTSAAAHLILDLSGWWTPVTTEVAGGRYQPIGPNRILDTRPISRKNYVGSKPAAQTATVVQVTGVEGVPITGVSAVSVNITLVDPSGPGFVQTAPAAQLIPGQSSTMNVVSAGQVIAASTLVPVDANGRIAIYAEPSTHLIVDVNGWFTDGTNTAGIDGLFVATTVGRQLDSRPGGQGYVGPKPTVGSRFETGCAGAALVGNLTVAATEGPGFVQAGPAATMVSGATSSINVSGANETRANALITPCNHGVALFTSFATHVILDVSGYMT